jgi:branched-chain amino acid aminotransferase
MTGTAAEITPVREVDRLTIGESSPGPITKMIQDTYTEGVRGKVEWMKKYITHC